MAQPHKSFVVIGLGTFGSTVAAELVRFGNHVIGIDMDEKRVSRMADTLSEAMIIDGRDELALREAGVGHYDVVLIAMGEDLEASILCTMNARLLGAKTIWVKASSRTHHRILSKLGADRIVHPEEEMGQHIAQVLHNPLVRDYVSLGNGFHVVNMIVPERLDGKTVDSLKLEEKFELRCLGVMRGSEFLNCTNDHASLHPDDKLLLLGRRASLRKFSDSI
ncbi:TrkA family potassium uptake protein [Thiothrix lacustris]|uniref:TrkA family potassium uptake protein n=1 Tax=Thiothrix lacustris TaxID=525917 RepID=A0ABY9MNX6_9GAMM|nr:TrkA family potassium uptake protein [Thiothrix lacustris]WML90067.1 TrkA family potassium uptake protein [Thiothrix lacustris]